MTALFLCRARLRKDASVRALAPLLMPLDDGARALADHRLVWSLMADTPDRSRDFLWRAEGDGGFLILAPRAPNDSTLFDVEIKPFAPALQAGDQIGFLLRANSTVAESQSAYGRGKRGRGKRLDVVVHHFRRHNIPRESDLVPPPSLRRDAPKSPRAEARPRAIAEEGAAWLARQGARCGFCPDPARLRIDGYDTVRVPRGDGKPAEFGVLDYEGVLEVTDPGAFLAALAAGIGRARAWGCGLMLIRRVR